MPRGKAPQKPTSKKSAQRPAVKQAAKKLTPAAKGSRPAPAADAAARRRRITELPPGDWQRLVATLMRRLRSRHTTPPPNMQGGDRVGEPFVFLEYTLDLLGGPFPLTPTGKPELDIGPRAIVLRVRNLGNHPSPHCHVQVLEGPIVRVAGRESDAQFFDLFKVKLERVISVGPGETVHLSFSASRSKHAMTLRAFCYDPIYFPRQLSLPNFFKPFLPPLESATVLPPPIKIGK